MADATFTFRVEEDLKAEFSSAAKARDRTGAQLLRDFMRAYVREQQATEYDAWLRREVRKGIEEADSGHVVPGDEVEARFAARREALKRRQGIAD